MKRLDGWMEGWIDVKAESKAKSPEYAYNYSIPLYTHYSSERAKIDNYLWFSVY